MAGGVTVRALRTLADIAPIEQLQTAIWGYGEDRGGHAYPARGLFAFVQSGGLVGGAYAGQGTLIGFSAAWIGRDPSTKRLYLHSQIVGVLQEFRDQGVGRLLKLQQRDFAREAGLTLVKWTFDPLRPRNAHFNLGRLGAVARRFEPDFYGALGGKLNGGRATDRLWAEWYVASAHVERRLHAAGTPTGPVTGEYLNRMTWRHGQWVAPDFALDRTAPTLLLELPADLDAADATAGCIADLQRRLRPVFGRYLPRYTITDCVRQTDRVTYVLQRNVDADLTEAGTAAASGPPLRP